MWFWFPTTSSSGTEFRRVKRSAGCPVYLQWSLQLYEKCCSCKFACLWFFGRWKRKCRNDAWIFAKIVIANTGAAIGTIVADRIEHITAIAIIVTDSIIIWIVLKIAITKTGAAIAAIVADRIEHVTAFAIIVTDSIITSIVAWIAIANTGTAIASSIQFVQSIQKIAEYSIYIDWATTIKISRLPKCCWPKKVDQNNRNSQANATW